ncbi:MAG: sporulation transcription factor Spo0A [Oscillospiraceae bacterium]
MSTNVKVLIGDDSNEFGKIYAGAIQDAGFVSFTCRSDGGEVLKAIGELSPDIVICDAIMPTSDAVDVIRRCADSKTKPFFIVISQYRNAYIEQQVMSCSNAYFLLKPFDTETLLSVVQHITPSYVTDFGGSGDEAHMEMVVTDIIHQIGIPAHIKGYHYLREAILLAISDSDMLESVTKLLYPAVARKFDTSPSRVERAIRHAIETAWDRGDVDILNGMFGYTINGGKGKPTNSEFIALITDNLRLRFKMSAKEKRADKTPA